MLQKLLPIIPPSSTPINNLISVVREHKQWIYFCGIQPVFQHADDDLQSFRMFTAQLCCQGACKFSIQKKLKSVEFVDIHFLSSFIRSFPKFVISYVARR
jgi:hypothetical protein